MNSGKKECARVRMLIEMCGHRVQQLEEASEVARQKIIDLEVEAELRQRVAQERAGEIEQLKHKVLPCSCSDPSLSNAMGIG